MTRCEKMRHLIEVLLSENPLQRIPVVPEDAQSQWKLLRSLMNLRAPGPVSDLFLAIQDDLLQDLLVEKGIIGANSLPALPGETNLALWQGDITRLRADAIVNAANKFLLGCFHPCHGCIDNAIHTFAGVQLRNECDALMRAQGCAEPTGRAQITSGYNLPAKHVIHTVGPIVHGALTLAHKEQLESCYHSCLALADREGLSSLAFCCISTGAFHFPPARAAQIAVQTVKAYQKQSGSSIKVVFNVFTDADREIYKRLFST